MRTLAVAALIAACWLGGAPAARAQVFGQYAGAKTVPMNGHLFGGYLSASDNVVGLDAQLRLSFYPNVDFGFQGGLSRVRVSSRSDRAVLRLGTDVKFAVSKAAGERSVDLALDAGLGVESGDNYQVLAVTPALVVSHDYGRPDRGMTPFASVGLQFSNVDVNDKGTTHLSVPLRAGADWRVAPDVRVTGEMRLRIGDDFGDDVSFSLGVNLPF